MAALQGIAKRGATADPVIRDRLVDSMIGLEIMGYNNLRTLSSALRNGEFGPEASMGKYYWSKWHQEFTELAMEVLGNDGWLGLTGGQDRIEPLSLSAAHSSARAPRRSMREPARSRRTSSASAFWACPEKRAQPPRGEG